MNWRAIGCAGLVIVVVVAGGIWGLSLASQGSIGCTDEIVTAGARYRADGPATPELRLPSGSTPELLGEATVGLTTRTLYGPPGSLPETPEVPQPPGGEQLPHGKYDPPDELAMDCEDGTYRAYVRSAT